jgi:hypothetical protein
VSETTPPIADDGSPEPPPVIVTTGSRPGPPSLIEYQHRQLVGQLADLGKQDGQHGQRDAYFLMFTAIPGGLASAVVHLLLLITLGVCMLATSEFGAKNISIEVVEVDSQELLEDDILDELAMDFEALSADDLAETDDEPWDSELFDNKEDLVTVDMDDVFGAIGLDDGASPMFTTGTGPGQGFSDHRHPGGGLASRAQRRRHALAYGATPESENAIELALQWLAKHQRRDGSWSFNHRTGDHDCEACRCGNPGSRTPALNGATAMGLLPFMGAGYTHLEGKYRKQVAVGLCFLMRNQKPEGSLFDPSGRMYSHGLATLALCEALAMTRYQYHRPTPRSRLSVSSEIDLEALDRVASGKPVVDLDNRRSDDGAALDLDQVSLANAVPLIELDDLTRAAQLAVIFIEKAQHSRGGWRYTPGQAGDTSVVGWQMMALRSAYLAGLEVDPATLKKATRFLNAVSEDKIGSCYGYTNGKRRAYVSQDFRIGATTPIGLLCRMYTGWDRSEKGLVVGVERIGRWARPSQGMYFYYYATQVLHHFGGPTWRKWNGWMRDYLVKSQSRKGSEAGSWSFSGPHDDAGRLYCTAMATMTLEIYYRYSPVYGEAAVTTASGTDE